MMQARQAFAGVSSLTLYFRRSRKLGTMALPISSHEDSNLIADLHKVSKAKPKLIKSSVYLAPADPSITVRSWKMNEYKYYDIPSPFPTLARGLFTTESSTAGDNPKYKIVARGYDKFFNINEVPWTSVSTHLDGAFSRLPRI
jgi:tRNA ligase